MAREVFFHTDTVLVQALRTLLQRLEAQSELKQPLTMYLAGGMAAHLYTALRPTVDVDAEFSRRILIPNDLMIEIEEGPDAGQLLYFDTNYNPAFALMHEDYQADSIPVPLGLSMIEVRVLSPVDLAVSKIARYSDNDREDIEALIKNSLCSADEIERRATEALGGYVGNVRAVEANVREVIALARTIESRARQKR